MFENIGRAWAGTAGATSGCNGEHAAVEADGMREQHAVEAGSHSAAAKADTIGE